MNNMKITMLVLPVILYFGFAFSANAGVRCSTDYFGNQTCYGTGNDSGYRSQGSTDYFGNQTWTDNKGNRTRCTTDYFGNTNCN